MFVFAVLKDDVDKDCFRLARFAGDASEVMKQAWYGGEAELQFDAMPQRFLTVGQKEYTMKKGGILRNPTGYAAKPKITLAGSGSAVLHIGSYTVSISNIGNGIIIEQRKAEEVTTMWYEQPMVTEGVKVYNPAFDVTDADLISGIITEFGVAYPPYKESLERIFLKKEVQKNIREILG